MNLEKIGQLAVELHAATLVRKNSKSALQDKYLQFCHGSEFCFGINLDNDSDGYEYIREGHPEYAAMQEYAAEEVKAYARAKLTEYNLKRKLDRAVRRYAAGGAQ